MATYAEIIYCKNCAYYKSYYHEYNRIEDKCFYWLRSTGPWDFCSKAAYKENGDKLIKEVEENE